MKVTFIYLHVCLLKIEKNGKRCLNVFKYARSFLVYLCVFFCKRIVVRVYNNMW